MLFFTVLKISLGLPREHLMIYRGPGFLPFVYFGPSSTPPPSHATVSKLSLFPSLPLLIDKRGDRGWRRSQTQRESLALYKSFNTLWVFLS